MLTVKSCCCGCSLRLGTLLILLIHAIVFVPKTYIYTTTGIIGLCIFILGFVGVFLRSPNCLIPFMIVQWIIVVVCLLYVISTVVLSQDYWKEHFMNRYPDLWNLAQKTGKQSDYVQWFKYVAAAGAILVFFGNIYFAIVVRSFYKEMKEDANG